jgi:hypothetical protein
MNSAAPNQTALEKSASLRVRAMESAVPAGMGADDCKIV